MMKHLFKNKNIEGIFLGFLYIFVFAYALYLVDLIQFMILKDDILLYGRAAGVKGILLISIIFASFPLLAIADEGKKFFSNMKGINIYLVLLLIVASYGFLFSIF